VFQIASIILWSLDNYYYYAFCIAVISMGSIITALLETKKVQSPQVEYDKRINFVMKTIARMREMSRYSCKMDVLVDGTCKFTCWAPTNHNTHKPQGKSAIQLIWSPETSSTCPTPN